MKEKRERERREERGERREETDQFPRCDFELPFPGRMTTRGSSIAAPACGEKREKEQAKERAWSLEKGRQERAGRVGRRESRGRPQARPGGVLETWH